MSDCKIHQQVEAYFTERPEFRSHVRCTGDGQYNIDGRDVAVGFCRAGYLVVHDGPLRQPFTDYVEKKESTAIYHNQGLKNSSLNQVPKETRISFGDEGNRYSRLDAMKVAKEQAIFREKAATYMNEGQMVPGDLRDKYEKTIDMKLGNMRRRFSPQAEEQQAPAPAPPAGPAWWPGTPTAAATATAAPLPAPPPPPQVQQTAPGSQQPQLPMTPVPPVGLSHQANLFGKVPDLFQIAAGRSQPGAGMLSGQSPVASPLHVFGSVGLKAPMGVGLHHPRRSVAGAFCGA